MPEVPQQVPEEEQAETTKKLGQPEEIIYIYTYIYIYIYIYVQIYTYDNKDDDDDDDDDAASFPLPPNIK